jgi:hypothetical protein
MGRARFKSSDFLRFVGRVERLKPEDSFVHRLETGRTLRITHLAEDERRYRVNVDPKLAVDVFAPSTTWPILKSILYYGELEKCAEFIDDIRANHVPLDEKDAVVALEKAGIDFKLQLYRKDFEKNVLTNRLKKLAARESLTRRLDNGMNVTIARTTASITVQTPTLIATNTPTHTYAEQAFRLLGLIVAENSLYFYTLITNYNTVVTVAGQKMSSDRDAWLTRCFHLGLNPCIETLINAEETPWINTAETP